MRGEGFWQRTRIGPAGLLAIAASLALAAPSAAQNTPVNEPIERSGQTDEQSQSSKSPEDHYRNVGFDISPAEPVAGQLYTVTISGWLNFGGRLNARLNTQATGCYREAEVEDVVESMLLGPGEYMVTRTLRAGAPGKYALCGEIDKGSPVEDFRFTIRQAGVTLTCERAKQLRSDALSNVREARTNLLFSRNKRIRARRRRMVRQREALYSRAVQAARAAC